MGETHVKKLFGFLFVLLLLAAAAGVGAIYYVRPDPALNLQYEPVAIKEKALEMVKRMSFDMILSEEDVNNVLKKSLAQNPVRNRDVEVRGANFTVAGDRLTADLSLLWKNRIPAGVQVIYRLSWQQPDLVATVEQVKVKSVNLPSSLADDLVLPIGRELPKPLKIKEVQLGEKEVTIVLQKPGLMDLQQLIG
jgi:hypothetical protein